MKASEFFKSSPMVDRVEVVLLCDECGHYSERHADEDYDFDGERYRRMPQPCQVEGCDCQDFFRP